MKLRRLLLLSGEPDPLEKPKNASPPESRRPGADTAEEPPEGSDWDLIAELDRLRATTSGLKAEVQRQTQIGQDYARAASEQRLRVEELDRENAIAHTNCQMLERRASQAEERAGELEELVEALRAQRDRLQTFYEQQKERAERADATSAALRDAAGELLAASDLQAHSAVGTRGLARAKVEFGDALAKLRRALDRRGGNDFLAPEVVELVRQFFSEENLPVDEKKRLRQAIVRALGTRS
jgi:hypothetical protein